MAKESTLSDREKESIVIEKFIFHLIRKDDLQPDYLDEVILSESQINFFKQRFIDASSGVQFNFVEKVDSDVYNHCKDIIENPDENFYPLSRRLASNFKGVFKGTSSDGVFVVSVVSILNSRLLFLLKMDHRKVYQYKVTEDRRALIEEIKNNLVEDKLAIQKNAIIDISDFKPWDILVLDRTRPGGITDYFRDFLKAIERDDASRLTIKVFSAVNAWASMYKDSVSEDQSFYKEKTISYMKSKGDNTLDSDELIEFVISDENQNIIDEHRESLKNILIERDLYKREFVPKPNSLSYKKRKNVRKSSEGVKVEWEGNPNTKGLVFDNDHDNNIYKIIVSSNSPFKELSDA